MKEQPQTVAESKRRRQSMLAVQVGLAANIVLAVVKCTVGILSASPALLADGINSTSDVAYGVVVSIFVRLSAKPADHEHPYGHDQLESVAAVVVGAFVITTAIAIFWYTVATVYELLTAPAKEANTALIALWVALGVVLVKLGLAAWTYAVSRRVNNSVVLALAHDHRNDIFASAAAALGILFARMGYPWVDPLAATVVSLIILHTGVDILRSATADLMDTVPGRELERQIRSNLEDVTGLLVLEDVHAHRFGPWLVANLIIGVDGEISVCAGHQIATEVEQRLLSQVESMRRVYVHYRPVNCAVRAPGDGPLT